MATISRGQTAPQGFVITTGGVSGVCQADTCTIEPVQPATPVADTAQTMRPSEPPQLTLRPRNPLISQRAAPQQCVPQPDGSCQPKSYDLTGYASPVVLPQLNPGFTPEGTADPYNAFVAAAFLESAKSTRVPSAWKGGGGGGAVTSVPDPSRSVVTAALGSSAAEAARLRAQGVDPTTATAIALRRALDDGGYSAAGHLTGVSKFADTAVNSAAQREAERIYSLGGHMTPAGRAVLPEAPGTIITDAAGNLWQATTSGAEPLEISPEAAASPITVPMLIGGQVYNVFSEQAKRKADIAKALATANAQGASRESVALINALGRADVQQQRDAAAAQRQKDKAAEKPAAAKRSWE